MDKIITGKAYVLGDNIDTDQIIPAEHLVYSLTDEEESKKYGMYALSGVPLSKAGLPQGNTPFMIDQNFESEYSIIIGGSNFGCGSSREHAPYALQKAGVKAIIAQSYARIFYRNAIDGGFVVPYEISFPLNQEVKTGDILRIDVQKNTIYNDTTFNEHVLNALGEVLPIIEAGGLFQYARTTNMI